MDLNKKLNFYRSEKKNQQSPAIPSSLLAIREIFDGEICARQAPYLKIIKDYPLARPQKVNLAHLSKYSIPDSVTLDKCLFFDLETTGLAGGSGTFPFLLGFGYFKDQIFRVEQFFLPDYGREYFLFEYLTILFKRFSYFVSFNGKSFDLPLLKNRFILNRFHIDWKPFIHIDLLHISRRIWKDSLKSLELSRIETHLLNRKRKADIPGSLIPQAYFSYITSGLIHDVKRIIEHNYLDILSLADLLLLLSKIEKVPKLLQDERAWKRLARLGFELNDFEYFNSILKLFSTDQQKLPDELIFKRGLFFKKQKKWNEAVADWKALLTSNIYLFAALEELAKYYEHVNKNFKTAILFAERALQHFETIEQLRPYSLSPEIKIGFLKRQHRLQMKQMAEVAKQSNIA